MAILTCPECGYYPLSDNAESCLRCGNHNFFICKNCKNMTYGINKEGFCCKCENDLKTSVCLECKKTYFSNTGVIDGYTDEGWFNQTGNWCSERCKKKYQSLFGWLFG